jgi:hypothetical protein
VRYRSYIEVQREGTVSIYSQDTSRIRMQLHTWIRTGIHVRDTREDTHEETHTECDECQWK